MVFCFFKQKTADEMRISDWSSDVCSSDLRLEEEDGDEGGRRDGVEGAVLQRASADADHRLDHHRQHGRFDAEEQGLPIGRASCRERVCQYVSISVVAASLKKQLHLTTSTRISD